MSEKSSDRSALEEEIKGHTWFHAIDFGEFCSSGRFPKGDPQNQTLFGVMELMGALDLDGKSFLDIGTSDGLASFGANKMGAKVTAIDSYDLQTFRLARKILGLDVNYNPGVQIKDAVGAFGYKKFDTILCAGVIYHMLNPMSAFHESRKLIKDGGIFIMETPVQAEEERPVMVLNSEDEAFYKELYTYWIPSVSCVKGMMKLVGFDVKAVRLLKNPLRVTVMGQAVPLNEVRERTELLGKIHEVDFCDFEFRLKDLARHQGTTSFDTSHIKAYREIVARKERVDFPFQPISGKHGLGESRWLTKTGNYPDSSSFR